MSTFVSLIMVVLKQNPVQLIFWVKTYVTTGRMQFTEINLNNLETRMTSDLFWKQVTWHEVPHTVALQKTEVRPFPLCT